MGTNWWLFSVTCDLIGLHCPWTAHRVNTCHIRSPPLPSPYQVPWAGSWLKGQPPPYKYQVLYKYIIKSYSVWFRGLEVRAPVLSIQAVARGTSMPFPYMPSPLGPPASLSHQTSMALFMSSRTENLNEQVALGPWGLRDFLLLNFFNAFFMLNSFLLSVC